MAIGGSGVQHIFGGQAVSKKIREHPRYQTLKRVRFSGRVVASIKCGIVKHRVDG
jgi:hypothetical protein